MGPMESEGVSCVVVAERHFGLTQGVRGLLETAFGAVVVVADEVSLFESLRRLRPVMAVVDFSLVPGSDLRWFRRLRSVFPQIRLVMISVHDEPSVCRAALEAGADAFVVKRSIATDLLTAIEAIQAGRSYVSPAMFEGTALRREGRLVERGDNGGVHEQRTEIN